jgi:hypothetical protein
MKHLKDKFDINLIKKKVELEEQIRLKSSTFNNRLHQVNLASSLENSL